MDAEGSCYKKPKAPTRASLGLCMSGKSSYLKLGHGLRSESLMGKLRL